MAQIPLYQWIDTAAGQYFLENEQKKLDQILPDIFGYHALQLGMPEIKALSKNRMAHRFLALNSFDDYKNQSFKFNVDFFADFEALPFSQESIDAIVLPHTLEFAKNAHSTLREAHRILMNEGKIIITGFNPASIWGLRHGKYLPTSNRLIALWRLKEWLSLLGFDILQIEKSCWNIPTFNEKVLSKFSFMDNFGGKYLYFFGAIYIIVAVKRIHGAKLTGLHWKNADIAKAYSAKGAIKNNLKAD